LGRDLVTTTPAEAASGQVGSSEKKAKKLRQIGSENTKILAKIEVAS
jgi:hypothetical protein